MLNLTPLHNKGKGDFMTAQICQLDKDTFLMKLKFYEFLDGLEYYDNTVDKEKQQTIVRNEITELISLLNSIYKEI